ncbi:hypothetical protein [Sphingomonas sp. Root710]|uniref:hypothetical protein n=1 Tax=Sphingomonas sp. Root710 TaxID=1736594 RepID=UPI0012E3EFE8|nr:hypothetical protein [Sphingomonas sp. Root710]
MIDLENELSPLEIWDLWQRRAELPEAIIAPLGRTIKMMMLGAKDLRRFERTTLSENVFLYRGAGGAGQKTLLIGFGGNVNRLMLPTAIFLQFVPDADYDMLLLRDPTRSGYLRGVPGFGDDLVKMADAIRSHVDLGSYREVRCVGTSGGGQVALYMGLLLDARRAVSVGGRHRSLSKKVAAGDGEFTGYELDKFVQNLAPRSTELINLFGAQCERDTEGARSLEKVLPQLKPVTIAALAEHNALAYLLEQGSLSSFFSRILLSETVG